MPAVAHADVGLMLEQPIGTWGRISGAGHVAIYLSRICAETPTMLRLCRPGEAGVVISRYDHADRHDWTAIPLIPYLYAVDQPTEIPRSIDAQTVAGLRDRYRRMHLEGVAPDSAHGRTPHGHWTELVGSAYERKIYVFEIETSVAQDLQLIQMLNARPNNYKFNLFFRNCANFAQSIFNFYYPHAIHRSFTADVGLVTPKQVAKSLVSYAEHHDNLQFSIFEIPQVPGKIHRSGKVYGVVEALLKKKQYVIPLVALHPFVTAALVGTYIVRGRFNPARNAVVLDQSNEMQALLHNAVPQPGEVQTGYLKNTAIPLTDLDQNSQNENCFRDGCDHQINAGISNDVSRNGFRSNR